MLSRVISSGSEKSRFLAFALDDNRMVCRNATQSASRECEVENPKCHFKPNSLAALPPKTFSLSSAVSPSIPLIAETCPASIIGVG